MPSIWSHTCNLCCFVCSSSPSVILDHDDDWGGRYAVTVDRGKPSKVKGKKGQGGTKTYQLFVDEVGDTQLGLVSLSIPQQHHQGLSPTVCESGKNGKVVNEACTICFIVFIDCVIFNGFNCSLIFTN